jgi:hypothetical protein
MPIEVYLETTDDGWLLAHGPLIGAVVRGRDRAAVLAAMPGEVERLRDWYRRHGDEIEPTMESAGDVMVIEEQVGWAPIRHGDRAALFRPDLQPVTRSQLDGLLAIADYARQDLLALVRQLPDSLLDRPTDDGTAIRAILRHVGNAGEWYVSRLVQPETLPPEWANDERLPIVEFLEMEGRTALDRLHRLTDAELAAVVTQPRWTDHPDELWTARKALRRRIEHELEHLGQVEPILANMVGQHAGW